MKKIQDLEDKIQEVELEEKEGKLRTQTTTEVIEKTATASEEGELTPTTNSVPSGDLIESPRTHYLNALRKLENRIFDCFSDDYDCRFNQALDGAEYDLILQSTTHIPVDLIVDIKLTSTPLSRHFAINTVAKLVLSAEIYETETGRKSTPILLIVFREPHVSPAWLSQTQEAIDKELSRRNAFAHLIVLTEHDLDVIGCDKLRNMFTMLRTPVSSSNIKTIGYDEATKTLEIEFRNGSIYQYRNVPLNLYKGLISAGSSGQYLAANIKNNFPFSKLK